MAVTGRRSSGPVLRSVSPSGRFSTSSSASRSISSSSSKFASSTTTFSARSSGLVHRSTSPTRVNYRSSSSSTASVRFSLDRSLSPSRSISVLNSQRQMVQKPGKTSLPKKTCMCSPTNHPGSFRCSLHKSFGNGSNRMSQTVPYNSNRLNMRRSAMTNSLVRIGTVEGDLVKRALAALIRPSSHQQRRRENFKARATRLSRMTKA